MTAPGHQRHVLLTVLWESVRKTCNDHAVNPSRSRRKQIESFFKYLVLTLLLRRCLVGKEFPMVLIQDVITRLLLHSSAEVNASTHNAGCLICAPAEYFCRPRPVVSPAGSGAGIRGPTFPCAAAGMPRRRPAEAGPIESGAGVHLCSHRGDKLAAHTGRRQRRARGPTSNRARRRHPATDRVPAEFRLRVPGRR